MKKFFMILMAALAVAGSNAATIWTGSVATGEWGSQEGVSCVKVGNANFATAEAGDKLSVTLSDAADGSVLLFKNGSSWENLDGIDGMDVSTPGVYSIQLTQGGVGELKSSGLILQGNNITITAVELTGTSSFRTVDVWTGDSQITWSDSEAPGVDGSRCVDLKAGDLITVTVSEIKGDDWPKCCFRTMSEGNADLGTIELWDFKNDAMPIEKSLVVTADNLEQFQAGFYIVGCGCRITKISLGIKEGGSPAEPVDGTVLWQGASAATMTWGDNGVTVSASKTECVEVGGEIAVTINSIAEESTEAWPKIVVRCDDGWDEITTIELWDDRSAAMPLEKSFVVTEEMMPMIAKGFNLGGTGATVSSVVYRGEKGGVSTVATDQTERKVDIYTVQGRLVRRGADASAVAGLPAGIYIAGGKKLIVR